MAGQSGAEGPALPPISADWEGGLGEGNHLMSLALPQEFHFAGASRLLYLAQNPPDIYGVLAGSTQSI